MAAAPAFGFTIPPPPPRFVYDGAGLLPANQKAALEERVLAISRRSGVQVAVAIFPSLEGEALEDVTIRVAEAWKPGQKSRDNGAIIALFLKEKKIRIEVGYGLEGAVPDGVAGRIIRDVIAPEFRRGDFAGGLAAGADAIKFQSYTASRIATRPAA